MPHEHSQRCEELRKALRDNKSLLEAPHRDDLVVDYGSVEGQRRDSTPDARPEVLALISQLEQALREEGCTGLE